MRLVWQLLAFFLVTFFGSLLLSLPFTWNLAPEVQRDVSRKIGTVIGFVWMFGSPFIIVRYFRRPKPQKDIWLPDEALVAPKDDPDAPSGPT